MMVAIVQSKEMNIFVYPNLIQPVVNYHGRLSDPDSYWIFKLNIFYLLFSFIHNPCNSCFNSLSFALLINRTSVIRLLYRY
jgi:hypothetical protein